MTKNNSSPKLRKSDRKYIKEKLQSTFLKRNHPAVLAMINAETESDLKQAHSKFKKADTAARKKFRSATNKQTSNAVVKQKPLNKGIDMNKYDKAKLDRLNNQLKAYLTSTGRVKPGSAAAVKTLKNKIARLKSKNSVTVTKDSVKRAKEAASYGGQGGLSLKDARSIGIASRREDARKKYLAKQKAAKEKAAKEKAAAAKKKEAASYGGQGGLSLKDARSIGIASRREDARKKYLAKQKTAAAKKKERARLKTIKTPTEKEIKGLELIKPNATAKKKKVAAAAKKKKDVFIPNIIQKLKREKKLRNSMDAPGGGKRILPFGGRFEGNPFSEKGDEPVDTVYPHQVDEPVGTVKPTQSKRLYPAGEFLGTGTVKRAKDAAVKRAKKAAADKKFTAASKKLEDIPPKKPKRIADDVEGYDPMTGRPSGEDAPKEFSFKDLVGSLDITRADKEPEYDVGHKHGGKVSKGMKKVKSRKKVKGRKRAALRGYRAELRGG
jgi:hypothetical protein